MCPNRTAYLLNLGANPYPTQSSMPSIEWWTSQWCHASSQTRRNHQDSTALGVTADFGCECGKDPGFQEVEYSGCGKQETASLLVGDPSQMRKHGAHCWRAGAVVGQTQCAVSAFLCVSHGPRLMQDQTIDLVDC